jgi:hypothetical protein
MAVTLIAKWDGPGQTVSRTADAGAAGATTRAGTVCRVARDTSGGPVTIGGSAALIIIGAILRFAITWTPKYVNIQAMGVILMLGGIVGLGISVSLLVMRRRSQMGTQVTERRRYMEPPT